MSGIFGQTDTSNPFGGNVPQGQSSVFGKTTPFGQTQNQSSSQTQSSVFGQMSTPTFGNQQASSFGSPATVTSTTAITSSGFNNPFMSKDSSGAGGTQVLFGTSSKVMSTSSAMTTGVVFGQQGASSVQETPAGITTGASSKHSRFGGTTFGQSSSLFGQGKDSASAKTGFSFETQTFGQFGQKQSNVSTALSGTGSSVFSGKMTSFSGFGKSTEAPSSTAFSAQSAVDSKLVFTAPATSSSQQNIFGGTKTETSHFGRTGTNSGVFGGQKISVASEDSSGQHGTKVTSMFGKTGTTAAASGTQQPKYVAPSNNVFGSSSNPPQTSVSSLFGGSKSFGTTTKSTSQFTFTTTASTVASGKPETKSSTEDKGSEEVPQRRFVRKDRKQSQEGTSEHVRRSIFSKAVAGAMKREVDTKHSKSHGKLSDTVSESQVDEYKHKYRRTSSSTSAADDLSEKVAIICKGIPAQYNKGQILRRHFSKFGSVAKVFPNLNKGSAVIHFHNHESASDAKKNGRVMAKGIPTLQIFWSSYTPKLSTASTTTLEKSRKIERSTSRKEVPRKSKWSADDVDDELECMAGTSDVRHSSVHTLERQPKDSTSKKTSDIAGHSSESSRRSDMSPAKTDTVSLHHLARVVAKTNQEKIQVLDQRDKLIRQARAKQRDLSTAKAFIGMCSDMCPEKERYDREDKRRLSIFELAPASENISGQNPRADYSRCVKEYSRASADQEEPLPHELRPEQVLDQTMTYLLKEIVDRGDESNWGEWYQFLWDRTRGIRKEITQQQLCTPAAVGLIEKCVRFHVFCSERLCEVDMIWFDEKINNENLTKCLQTLKEFYHDLERKHQYYCPNEAEFRAYIVLMNLNEGDTLREIQQLRPEIRNTREVSLAIKVYNALNSNNFVRFFRLVGEASFLGACIMHRYFNQVRQKALSTVLKAYRGKTTKFPLQDLIRMLFFESSQEAHQFCEFYGLEIQDDAVLERSSFIIPETAFPPMRSRKCIEMKRFLPVGEVINGEPFGPFAALVPSSSFDSDGKFIVSSELKAQVLGPSSSQTSQTSCASSTQLTAGVSSSVSEVSVANEESLAKPDAAKAVRAAFSNEVVKLLAKDLFIDVIDELVLDISRAVLQAAYDLHSAAQVTVDELIETTTTALVREVCQNEYEEELARKEEYNRQEREMSIARVALSVSEEIIQDVVDQEIKNHITAEVRELHAIEKRERIDRCTKSICDELTKECVSSMVHEVSTEVHQVDVVERLKQLADIEQCVKLHRAGRFLLVWKKQYADRIKLKRAMLAFPCAPSCQSIAAQLRQLLPDRGAQGVVSGAMYLGQHARLNIESPVDTVQRSLLLTAQISLKCLHQHLVLQNAWQPFDVVALVGQQIKNAFLQNRDQYLHLTVPHVFWKLVVALPESGAGLWSSEVNTWISNKFHRGQVPSHPLAKYKGEVLCLYHKDIELETRLSLKLGICVRTVIGNHQQEVEMVKENRLLLGTSAIIFVLPEQHQRPTYWQEAQERLELVLCGKPADPALPLVVVVPQVAHDGLSQAEVAARLDIQQYVVNRLVLDVHWIFVNLPHRYSSIDGILPNLLEKVSRGLQWLASRCPCAPPLTGQPVKEYVEDFLLEEYFTPVLQNLKLRKIRRLLHQGPNVLITLYNNVVEHLAEVASTQDLVHYSWPVSEFAWIHSYKALPMAEWNTAKHLMYLYEEISLLQLPRFKYGDFDSSSWEQVCEDVWAYVSAVVAQNKGRQTVNLVSRIKSLLQNVFTSFEDVCFLEMKETGCEPTYVNMPWTDVIDACINYRLTNLAMWDPHNMQQGSRHELMVYYRDEDLQDYATPQSWEDAAMVSDLFVEETVESTFQKAASNKTVSKSMPVEGSSPRSNPDSDETMESDNEEVLFRHSDEELTIPRKIPKYSQSYTQNVKNLNNNYFRNSSQAGISLETERDVSLQSDCETLAQSIRAEKRKSEKFSQYLESLLCSQHDPVVGEAVTSPCASPSLFREHGVTGEGEMEDEQVLDVTVAEKMANLKEKVSSQKKQSQLFEKRLQMLLNS